MIQDIGNHVLDNQYHPCEPQDDSLIFVFSGTGNRDDKILISQTEDTFSLPRKKDFHGAQKLRYLFSLDGTSCFLWMDDETLPEIPSGFAFYPVRSFTAVLPQELYFARMTAYHLFTWYRDTRFCGHCGKTLSHSEKERAMVCLVCGTHYYPKIAPAVIVGLVRGDSILISHYAGRAYKGRALLAGFCEIGETAEQTVAREIMEEVGLHVKNIRYFASQPWGIVSDLLLGYFAELDGDESITLDETELADAVFVNRRDLPEDPNPQSLKATMIEAFRTGRFAVAEKAE